jgi:YD repeat-containing protein
MKKAARLLAILLFGSLEALPQTNPNLENGIKPYGSYNGGQFDQVSLTNGNLHVRIPIISYQQRGKLAVSYSFVINAKNWYVKMQQPRPEGPVSYSWQYSGTGGVLFDQGIKLSKHSLQYGDQYTGITTVVYYTLAENDGPSHDLAPLDDTRTTWRSSDASGYLLQVDSAGNVLVSDRVGNRWTGFMGEPDGPPENSFAEAVLNRVTDSNGNYMNITGILGDLIDNQGMPTAIQVTDTLNRVISPRPTNTDLGDCPSNSTNAQQVLFPGLNGGSYSIKVCYFPVQLATSFQKQGVAEGTGTVYLANALVLPDHSKWIFSYDSYANLSSMTMPTGATVSYQWTTAEICSGSGTDKSRLVTSRTFNANDGTGSHATSYTWGFAPNVFSPIVNTVTDPAGNDSVHTITELAHGPCPYYETTAQHFQGSGSNRTLLKTVTTDYHPLAPAPIRVTTVWPNGKAAKVETDYDSGFTARNNDPNLTDTYTWLYGSVTSQREYDYGATTATRQTATTLEWQSDTTGNYLSSNLLDLPASVVLKDGTGNRCAETDYTYDETSYLTGASIGTQHDAAPGPKPGNPSTISNWVSKTALTGSTCNPSATGSTIVSHTNWYDTGMPYKSIDANNHETTYTYSSSFAGAYVTQTDLPDTHAPNLAHHVVSGNYDFNTGLLTSFTDQNGKITSYSYNDPLLRPTAIVYPDTDSSSNHGETDFHYPDPNTVQRQQRIDGSRWTNSYVQYDGLGRESRRATWNDQPGNRWDQVDTCYDAVGRVSFKPYAYQSTGFNAPKRCSNSTGPGDAFIYDGLGRIRSVAHSDNTVTTTEYGVAGNTSTFGSAVRITDEGNGSYNVQRILQTDGLGRLTSVCEVSGGTLQGSTGSPAPCNLDISGNGFLTSYGYDVPGNLISVTQAGTNRSFAYDTLSRLISAANPESGTTSYAYDADAACSTPNSFIGQLVKKVDARSVRTCMRYDEINRLTQKNYSDGTPTATFNYDEASITTSPTATTLTNTNGRQSSITTGSTGSLFSYDPMGRVLNDYQCTPRTCAGNSYYNLPYQYDLLGDATSAGNGMNTTFTSSFNSAGRLTQMTSSLNSPAAQYPGTLLSNASYSPFGLAWADLGNGWGETRTYHQRGWLQNQKDGPATNNAPQPGHGSVTISGNLNFYLQQTQAAQPAWVNIAITGVERGFYVDGGGDCYWDSESHEWICPGGGTWYWDTGYVRINVNGTQKDAYYQGGSDRTTIVEDLANQFNSDAGSTVWASPNGDIIKFTARNAGYYTNAYTFWTDAWGTDATGYFSGSSFGTDPQSGSLSGGQDAQYQPIYDSGYTSITVSDGVNSHTTPYGLWSGSGTTAASVAQGLCNAINGDSGG